MKMKTLHFVTVFLLLVTFANCCVRRSQYNDGGLTGAYQIDQVKFNSDEYHLCADISTGEKNCRKECEDGEIAISDAFDNLNDCNNFEAYKLCIRSSAIGEPINSLNFQCFLATNFSHPNSDCHMRDRFPIGDISTDYEPGVMWPNDRNYYSSSHECKAEIPKTWTLCYVNPSAIPPFSPPTAFFQNHMRSPAADGFFCTPNECYFESYGNLVIPKVSNLPSEDICNNYDTETYHRCFISDIVTCRPFGCRDVETQNPATTFESIDDCLKDNAAGEELEWEGAYCYCVDPDDGSNECRKFVPGQTCCDSITHSVQYPDNGIFFSTMANCTDENISVPTFHLCTAPAAPGEFYSFCSAIESNCTAPFWDEYQNEQEPEFTITDSYFSPSDCCKHLKEVNPDYFDDVEVYVYEKCYIESEAFHSQTAP